MTLPSDYEIVVTRMFDAPRELVFEASLRPEHVRRWWGPRHLTMTVCEADVRVGGAYRYVLRGPEGREAGFNGVYHEITPPERIVCTQIFEPMPEHVAVVTVIFEDNDGRTKLTSTTRHASKQARDGHLQSGMEAGMRDTFDRLEELLESLAKM
ncbi:MAG: SRPBCC family protein [Bryobacteraceae bacterium]|nr:SRPBCC family protein [Bryobacteraceae bacterium]